LDGSGDAECYLRRNGVHPSAARRSGGGEAGGEQPRHDSQDRRGGPCLWEPPPCRPHAVAIAVRPLSPRRRCPLHRRASSTGAMMVVNSLSAHACFKTLDPEACRVLDRHCTWLKTAAGQWLIGQTSNDRDVYFVMSGRLRAVLHGVRQDLIFTDMEAGSFF